MVVHPLEQENKEKIRDVGWMNECDTFRKYNLNLISQAQFSTHYL